MQLLKDQYNYNYPIIVLTANATEEAKRTYLQSGFDNYISKPVTKEVLYSVIKEYL